MGLHSKLQARPVKAIEGDFVSKHNKERQRQWEVIEDTELNLCPQPTHLTHLTEKIRKEKEGKVSRIGKNPGRWIRNEVLAVWPSSLSQDHTCPYLPAGPTHLFFNKPLKSSSPASSDFPSPLQSLRGL